MAESATRETSETRETATIVPVTGAIYSNGQEKPSSRWSFEIGLNLTEDKFLSTVLKRLEKGYGIKDKLSEKQVSEMRNWRAMHGQKVPQKTVRNMTTKDNPGTLPINLYAADAPTVQPLDFAVLSEAAAVPVPQRETTETLYKQSQIVCLKADSSDTPQLLTMACLQENVSDGMKRVKAIVFMQDPFNPVLFTEVAERYVNVSNIVCALTCYNYREDTLEKIPWSLKNMILSLSLMCFSIPTKSSLSQRQLSQLS